MAFDWETSPLEEAEKRLSDLKSIYEKARVTVTARQNLGTRGKIWKCWTQSHKKDILASMVKQCKVDVLDSSCPFRDDGALDDNNNRYSIVCCGSLCMQQYQAYSYARKAAKKGL